MSPIGFQQLIVTYPSIKKDSKFYLKYREIQSPFFKSINAKYIPFAHDAYWKRRRVVVQSALPLYI